MSSVHGSVLRSMLNTKHTVQLTINESVRQQEIQLLNPRKQTKNTQFENQYNCWPVKINRVSDGQ